MTELQRIVRVRPAYDCIVQPCGRNGCGERPGASHGRHNAEIHFILRSERAEIVLSVGTGWDLPETPRNMRSSHALRDLPRGMGVDFHSADPQYDGQEPRIGDCQLWRPCYNDVGFTMSDEPAELLVRKGSDAVWEWLEAKHQEHFRAEAQA